MTSNHPTLPVPPPGSHDRTDLLRRRLLGGLVTGAGIGALQPLSTVAAMVSGSGVPTPSPSTRTDRATSASLAYPEDWFRSAAYGVMVHFLGEDPGWNDRVDGFDVEGFAQQMASAQAGYVLFTLGQNSGYHCSPNATYDFYTGYAAGERNSRRDLPMDLADALGVHGIPMMLYLPARAPQYDAQALAGLSGYPENDQFLPAGQEFIRKWSEVIEEWSLRYGTKLRGWWFDGCYVISGWSDLSQPYNWATWAAACRAGNERSILAFNRGAFKVLAFIASTDEQDYTAGEQITFTETPETRPAPDGVQWHVLGHLGSTWGFIVEDGPRHPDAEMIDYIRRVNALGGVVTLDVAARNGEVYGPHLQQLQAIGAAVRAAPPVPSTDPTDPPVPSTDPPPVPSTDPPPVPSTDPPPVPSTDPPPVPSTDPSAPSPPSPPAVAVTGTPSFTG